MKKIILVIMLICGTLSASNNLSNRRSNQYDIPYHVETSWYKGIYAHRAYYQIENIGDVNICTVLDDVTGKFTIGSQYLVLAHYPYTVIDTSDEWRYEYSSGTKCFVYEYDKFEVYTSDNIQFVIDK